MTLGTPEIASIAVVSWLLIGFTWHRLVTLRSIRYVLKSAGLPMSVLPQHRMLLAMVIGMLVWPIAILLFVFAVIRSLWSKRKELKACVLGYWPLMAHSMNVFGHWLHLLEKLGPFVKSSGDPDLQDEVAHFNHHILELGYCIHKKHGNDLGFPWDQYVSEDEKLCKGEDDSHE